MWEVGLEGSAAWFCRDFPFPASIFLSADRYLLLLLSLRYPGLFYDLMLFYEFVFQNVTTDTDRQPLALSVWFPVSVWQPCD